MADHADLQPEGERRTPGRTTETQDAARRDPPRVRPARIFRTIVMCALAAAPAAGCGGPQGPEAGHVYRGGSGDATSGPVEPGPTPDYAIVEPQPGPMPEYAAPNPTDYAVPAYGVYPVPPRPDAGYEPAPEYAAPAPDEPIALYAMPMPSNDDPSVAEYMAPMPRK